MIELNKDQLCFSFPDVHPEAILGVDFQRTLRIPDDEKTYPLPPGLGRFPLCHVDDFASTVPPLWLEHGGVMLPMYQSEALWLNYHPKRNSKRDSAYPFAIKVAAGKINAVTGKSWNNQLARRPQDYMVAPEQPWLDGFCVRKGVIRQFVAMPLGSGYSAEEQITGDGEHGGLQVIVYPMKADVYERRFPQRTARRPSLPEAALCSMAPRSKLRAADASMGLAPGGQMRQEIYSDPYGLDDWDMSAGSRCFIHLTNSLVWQAISGKMPPTVPPTAKSYSDAGLPWFEYYGETTPALSGTATLSGLKSVTEMGEEKGDVPVPENEPVTPDNVVHLRSKLKRDQVREGAF